MRLLMVLSSPRGWTGLQVASSSGTYKSLMPLKRQGKETESCHVGRFLSAMS